MTLNPTPGTLDPQPEKPKHPGRPRISTMVAASACTLRRGAQFGFGIQGLHGFRVEGLGLRVGEGTLGVMMGLSLGFLVHPRFGPEPYTAHTLHPNA